MLDVLYQKYCVRYIVVGIVLDVLYLKYCCRSAVFDLLYWTSCIRRIELDVLGGPGTLQEGF